MIGQPVTSVTEPSDIMRHQFLSSTLRWWMVFTSVLVLTLGILFSTSRNQSAHAIDYEDDTGMRVKYPDDIRAISFAGNFDFAVLMHAITDLNNTNLTVTEGRGVAYCPATRFYLHRGPYTSFQRRYLGVTRPYSASGGNWIDCVDYFTFVFNGHCLGDNDVVRAEIYVNTASIFYEPLFNGTGGQIDQHILAHEMQHAIGRKHMASCSEVVMDPPNCIDPPDHMSLPLCLTTYDITVTNSMYPVNP